MSAWNGTKVLKALSRYFSATCTIQQISSTTPDAFGQDQIVWSDLHADITCSPVFVINMRLVGHMMRNQDEQYLESLRQVTLGGVYADVDTTMHLVIDSETYTIELVYTDSQQVITVLALRRIEVTSG